MTAANPASTAQPLLGACPRFPSVRKFCEAPGRSWRVPLRSGSPGRRQPPPPQPCPGAASLPAVGGFGAIPSLTQPMGCLQLLTTPRTVKYGWGHQGGPTSICPSAQRVGGLREGWGAGGAGCRQGKGAHGAMRNAVSPPPQPAPRRGEGHPLVRSRLMSCSQSGSRAGKWWEPQERQLVITSLKALQ